MADEALGLKAILWRLSQLDRHGRPIHNDEQQKEPKK